MAFIAVDATWRVSFLTACANIQAPTTTELNAGLLLTALIPPDGMQNFQPSTTSIPTASLADRFDTIAPGRTTFQTGTITFFKQPSADTTYTTLVYGTAGFIVIRRYIATATAYTSTQPLQVYPGFCGDRVDLDSTPNETAKWQTQWFFSAAPALAAAIA